MSGASEIDTILDQAIAAKDSLPGTTSITVDEFPPREVKLERLPSIPTITTSPEPEIDSVPTMVSVMYDNGSISYINLETVPVIQRTIEDTYLLMWPDTANGILLKTLYIFHRTSDPIAYQRIEAYLATKSR